MQVTDATSNDGRSRVLVNLIRRGHLLRASASPAVSRQKIWLNFSVNRPYKVSVIILVLILNFCLWLMSYRKDSWKVPWHTDLISTPIFVSVWLYSNISWGKPFPAEEQNTAQIFWTTAGKYMWNCFSCHFSHATVILESKKLNLDKLHELSPSEHVESRLRH